jgi:NAD(P)-dependent dehydrogenase (short-subunit alcohol dehydrogenase family)
MYNPLQLSGRRIIVTGASSGIGRETAIVLSRLGARVIIAARNRDRLQQTYVQLEGEGHRVEVIDLAKLDAIPSWLKSLAGEEGQFDGLVHSAGEQLTIPTRFLKRSQLDDIMRINFAAALELAKGFRQKGVCQSPSAIIFLSSVMGLVGQAGLSAYAASKGALVALARALAVEFAREGIRVNCVAPGLVRTEMAERIRKSLTAEQFNAIEQRHLLGLGQPSDIAHTVAFLLADTGRWITGSNFVVDGGYTAH